MQNILVKLRLLVFFLGALVLFVADRYYGADAMHMALRIVAFVLLVGGLAMTLALSAQATGRRLVGEAAGWKRVAAWQVVFILGLALYCVYVKVLGDKPVPNEAGPKVLLAVWLLLVTLGAFAGVGLEWAMRDTGHGENAEPGRVTRAGLAWLAVGMLLAFLVSINYAGDKKDVTRDLSYLHVRTPSEATGKMVAALDGDLTVALFYPQNNEVRAMLADYFGALPGFAGKASKVKVEYYDKDIAPTKAEEYRVSRNGQIVLDFKGKKSRIDTDITVTKARKKLKELDGEFQKAFLEITADRKTLYFTRGHGEVSWVGDATDDPVHSLKLLETFLRQQNYSTRLFGVAEGSAVQIPDDAAAVVIVGPTEPFQKEEIDAMRSYVESGGNLMVFMDVDKSTAAVKLETTGPDPLTAFLAEMGLKYSDVPIANDRPNNHLVGTHTPADVYFLFSQIFSSHESVATLARHDERVAVMVFQAGSFGVTPELGKWKAQETVRSLSDSFADTNRNFKFDEGEKREGYVFGAAAELKEKKTPAAAPGSPEEKKAKRRQGRVIAFADATAISDGLLRNMGNLLFFADSVKWLVGDGELAGQVANEEDVKIRHTRKEDAIYFYASVVAVPALVLVAGFLANRRKRKGDKNAA